MSDQRVALTSRRPLTKKGQRTATAMMTGALENTTVGRSSTMTTSCWPRTGSQWQHLDRTDSRPFTHQELFSIFILLGEKVKSRASDQSKCWQCWRPHTKTSVIFSPSANMEPDDAVVQIGRRTFWSTDKASLWKIWAPATPGWTHHSVLMLSFYACETKL